MSILTNIPDDLRALRKVHGLKLRELSERTGLSISFLSDIENGRTAPSLKTVERIANAYSIEAQIIFAHKPVRYDHDQ
jgi:transcriptional regulator with XRE-family HTH domain